MCIILIERNKSHPLPRYIIMKPTTMYLTRKTEGKIQTTYFWAHFERGEFKTLKHEWENLAQLPDTTEPMGLSPDTCKLYHLDWSKCPIHGDFSKHYPV